MLRDYVFSFFVFILINIQFDVKAEQQISECYAFSDPHIYTWHSKGSNPTWAQYQDCYEPGYRVLVENAFVDYKIRISKRWMIEADLFFYNGTSYDPLCLIKSRNFTINVDDDAECAKYGITWHPTRTATHYLMSVTYSKAEFHTTIQFDYASRDYAPHYNIYVWLQSSLAEKSAGICTLNDADCNPERRTNELQLEDGNTQPQVRTITANQAHTICQTHVNTYLSKSRRAPYQRSQSTNDTIANVLAGCEADVLFTGQPKAAESDVSVLMMEELTNGLTSLDSIQTTIDADIQQALLVLDQANKEAEIEVAQLLGFTAETPVDTTLIATTVPEVISTTTVPITPFKCGIYQDMYIQTWHPIDQEFPPIRNCFGITANFQLVTNNYISYTIHSNGSIIDELSLVLFDLTSTDVICNVTAIGQNIAWTNCEQNGINPSLINTPTHEQLTIDYSAGNFKTIVTRDTSFYFGRFNIIIHLDPVTAFQSTGICNLASACI